MQINPSLTLRTIPSEAPPLPARSPIVVQPPAHEVSPISVNRQDGALVQKLLSANERQRLAGIFETRAAVVPIRVVDASEQAPADPWNIFVLQKNGSDYSFLPTAAGPSVIPPANGVFLYVIRADAPGQIYIGAPSGSITVDTERFGIQGHTSISSRDDVLYAGEIVLEHGKIVSWNNGSGHYQPTGGLRHTNLLPVVKSMLPDALFSDRWASMTLAEKMKILVLRGYEIPPEPPSVITGHTPLSETQQQSPAISSAAVSHRDVETVTGPPTIPAKPISTIQLLTNNSPIHATGNTPSKANTPPHANDSILMPAASLSSSLKQEQLTQPQSQPVPKAFNVNHAHSEEPNRNIRFTESSVETTAKDVFKEVRKAYSEGLKSANKSYGLDSEDNFYENRATKAQDVIAAIRREIAINEIKNIIPIPQEKLVIDAANCGELARATAKRVIEQGGYAELWSFSSGADHAFTVIGRPPAQNTLDFANWKGVWIADSWAGIVCEAPDYIEKLNKKMQEWHSKGKVIRDRVSTASPIEGSWLREINEESKVLVKAPSADNPNPWKHFTSAVDYRRLLNTQDQDRQTGLLTIGKIQISRTELYDMGVVLDGKSIDVSGIQNLPSKGSLPDRLQFDGEIFEQKLQENIRNNIPNTRAHEILAEISTARTIKKPLLINRKGVTGQLFTRLNTELAKLGGLAARAQNIANRNMITYLMPGGSAVQHTGVGLQAFGIYNSIRGISDAIARGDTVDAVINGAGLGAEGASLAAEKGIVSLGKYLQKGNLTSFNAFAKISLGTSLGGTSKLGTNIGRTASGVGTIFTTPFDIYSATTSFMQAANTEGKISQDHTVDGSLAVAGAASSIVLAGAAYAGVAAAGPIGLAIGLGLAAGGHIYHNVRYVEDLDKYADLTGWEKFTTGLSSFFGGGASQNIEDRASVGKAKEHYVSTKKEELRLFLEANKIYGQAIFGDAIIKPQKPIVITAPLEFSSGGFPPFDEDVYVQHVQQPAIVIDNAADDTIDARQGIKKVNNAVHASHKQGDAVFWATGDGNDVITGVSDRSNIFEIGKGNKKMTGGAGNDTFRINPAEMNASMFNGGKGKDMLDMSFVTPNNQAPINQAPIEVVLSQSWNWANGPDIRFAEDENGELHLEVVKPPVVHWEEGPGFIESMGSKSILKSIENVTTSKTARTAVTGDRQDNVFVLNGNGDSAAGISGNDTYVVNGAGTVKIKAGYGENRYKIARSIETVNILTSTLGQGKDELNLDFDIGEFELKAVEDKLEIIFNDAQSQKKIVLAGVYSKDDTGEFVPSKKDGDILLVTRDGYIVTPVITSIKECGDGFINSVAVRKLTPQVIPPQNMSFVALNNQAPIEVVLSQPSSWANGPDIRFAEDENGELRPVGRSNYPTSGQVKLPHPMSS